MNAALFCRRPLLVTGRPGLGKSTLAYLIARELRLGPVLSWPINSRSTVWEGLYQYDALRRFEDARVGDAAVRAESGAVREAAASEVADIADYLTLGPLGTALLPYRRPRVLLIDEIDKADVDLPNDLLHVLEDGEYQIPELRRMRSYRRAVTVATHGGEDQQLVEVHEGLVRCRAFPIIVMTSNGERDFPPAFLRRVLQLRLESPDRGQVEAVVRAHLGDGAVGEYADVISVFMDRLERSGTLPTDRLLIAIHTLREASGRDPGLGRQAREDLAMQLMQATSRPW
ncbi:AAA family ATPase [Catenulispora yoronensis]